MHGDLANVQMEPNVWDARAPVVQREREFFWKLSTHRQSSSSFASRMNYVYLLHVKGLYALVTSSFLHCASSALFCFRSIYCEQTYCFSRKQYLQNSHMRNKFP